MAEASRSKNCAAHQAVMPEVRGEDLRSASRQEGDRVAPKHRLPDGSDWCIASGKVFRKSVAQPAASLEPKSTAPDPEESIGRRRGSCPLCGARIAYDDELRMNEHRFKDSNAECAATDHEYGWFPETVGAGLPRRQRGGGRIPPRNLNVCDGSSPKLLPCAATRRRLENRSPRSGLRLVAPRLPVRTTCRALWSRRLLRSCDASHVALSSSGPRERRRDDARFAIHGGVPRFGRCAAVCPDSAIDPDQHEAGRVGIDARRTSARVQRHGDANRPPPRVYSRQTAGLGSTGFGWATARFSERSPSTEGSSQIAS